jgi:hypothetical protein
MAQDNTWSFVETGRQLERQLAELQRQLQTQQVSIGAVEAKLGTFMTQDAHTQWASSLDSRLDRIEGALGDLKRQCHIPNHTGTSIGEAVASNMSSISSLQSQVAQRATIETMEEVTASIRSEAEAQSVHLDETKASKAFVTS